MKKALLAIAISLVFYSFSFAQVDSTQSNYALSFGIGNNFTLSNFNMDIAVKKIIDNKHQLRLFVSPRISTNDTKNSGGRLSSENKSQSYSLGIGADYLWILLNKHSINMYGGTGLILAYGHNYIKQGTAVDNTSNGSTVTNQPNIMVGLRGTLGVQWMVNQSIGIHCEYLLTGSYNWSRSEKKEYISNTVLVTNTSKSSSINLSTIVLFGVSIYL